MSHNGTVVQPNGAKPLSAPDPEVRPAPKRRTFTAEYKLRILADVDGCHAAGAVGALLRREGLYSSHLVEWRRQRASGELQAGATKVRGRKPTPGTPEAVWINPPLAANSVATTETAPQTEAIPALTGPQLPGAGIAGTTHQHQ